MTIPSSASSQREQFANAYSVLEQAIAEQAFPGAAFGVFAHGEVLALDGVGGFTYDAETPAVTPSTIYDLASVTKVIATTSMAMLLQQRGQLSLDQPLVELLPGFTQGGAVSLRLLLAHASGLPGYARLFAEYADRDALLLDACLRLPLTKQRREPAPNTPIQDSFCWVERSKQIAGEEPIESVLCKRRDIRSACR